MKAKTVRGYVWIFCAYLAITVEWLSGREVRHESNVHLSIFLTFFPLVISNVLLVWMFLSLVREVTGWVEKGVCILSAIAFALHAAADLYQFGYLTINVWPPLSGLSFLFATVLLGYRTDQILKKCNREIETNPCPAAS